MDDPIETTCRLLFLQKIVSSLFPVEVMNPSRIGAVAPSFGALRALKAVS